MDGLLLSLTLARTTGLHADMLRTAVEAAGSAAALPGMPLQQLRQLGLPAAAATWLHAPDFTRLDADRRWLECSGTQVIDVYSAHYPPLLTEIGAAPVVLFVRGDPQALLAVQVAMVGSRSPTAAGRATARDFSTQFARAGLVVTSGLALGIDTASHEGALEAKGRTVAVLGCGLDQIYPPGNGRLAQRVAAQGALVTEFPPGVPPLPEHFPRRNRILSGLAAGTLVIEAARRSGSLITARLAAEQGREVMAVPGSIHNRMAQGCHELIRQGARLVESAQEVMDELKIPHIKQYLEDELRGAAAEGSRPPALDNDLEILLDALEFEPTSMDVLVARTGLPSPSVASMLLMLELDGRVAPQPGGRYVRTA